MTGTLALGLLGGCLRKNQEEIPVPKRENYNNVKGVVLYYTCLGELYIHDIDNDWTASWIGKFGRACYIEPEFKPVKGVTVQSDTKIMTPELRKAASEALRADRELMYQMALADYNAKKRKISGNNFLS